MKIGIYGGTFDPIHVGHISIAEAVKKELGLDRLYFVVASDPPHKPDPGRTPAALRLKMAETALSGCKGMYASDIEIKREGKSYTADTVAEFKALYPGAELYFIVGADMLASFHTWYHPELILKNATLTAVQRTGQAEDLEELRDSIVSSFGGRVIVTNVCGPEASSTAVRNRIAEYKPISGMVNYETDLFIYENLLYAPEKLRLIRDRLALDLDESRLRHSLLTSREAIMLADHYLLDTEKAAVCGIVHDCAKLKGEKLRECMERNGFTPNDDESANPYLIHARLGAVAAKAEYGVDDEEILTAIERHTLGCPEMTPFDEVIFLADKLEPTREYRRIASLRKLAYKDLDAAVAAVIRNNINYNVTHSRPIHSSTMTTLKAIERRIRNKN